MKIIMLTYKAPIGLRGWGAGVLYIGICTQSTGIDTKKDMLRKQCGEGRNIF